MPLTAVMAPALKSIFEIKLNLKQNNLNFGETIYLKSRADAKQENVNLNISIYPLSPPSTIF